MAKQTAKIVESNPADNTNDEKKGGSKKVINPLHTGLFNVTYTVNGVNGRCRVVIETNDEFDDDTHGKWVESGEVYTNTLKDFATAVEAVEAKIAELCE